MGPEPYAAFIPAPLPPDPPILYDAELQELSDRANRELGRLDGVSTLLPNPALFLYMYIRKEAVLSAQIEGTQSSLSDLLLYENEAEPGVPLVDVQEVSNYVAAMEFGLARLKGGFPLSLRLIREIHGILLRGTRGAEKNPGEFRSSQNWVGGTHPGHATYVPPPPHEVMPFMGALEKFLHDDPVRVPLLIKVGLVHAQFETIHPFLDGNGRVGRLLITLLLCAEEALAQPLLYLSLYLKQHRQDYYGALQRIRTHGDWEGWLKFFLRGVAEVSRQAGDTAQHGMAMFEAHRAAIQGLGKGAASALRVYDRLRQRGILSIAVAARDLGMSQPTVGSAILRLEKLGIIRELTGKKRDRLFEYHPYLDLLREGTESHSIQGVTG